jgi:superfamily II DNA helicase RecQ
MIRYARSHHCRMATLVHHFGDIADSQTPCGICDFCNPAGSIIQRYREATKAEQSAALRIIAALKSGRVASTGKLHAELYPGNDVTRDTFEDVLGALARAELLQFANEVFEKDGKRIPYKTVRLTAAGRGITEDTQLELLMKAETDAPAKRTRRGKKTPTTRATGGKSSTKASERKQKPTRETEPTQPSALEEALRAWRSNEARRRGVPAFRIFTDRVMRSMVDQRPKTDSELLAIPGIGMATVKQYGNQLYRLLQQADTTTAP